MDDDATEENLDSLIAMIMKKNWLVQKTENLMKIIGSRKFMRDGLKRP